MELTNNDLLKSYKAFMTRSGYNVIYTRPSAEDDSGVFFVIQFDNKDNPKEPLYAFFEAFMGADLSLDGFKKTVIEERNVDDFSKMVAARIKGSLTNKSGIICCMLENNYMIDDIYKNGEVKLTSKILQMVSHWVNFKGGTSPIKRSQSGK